MAFCEICWGDFADIELHNQTSTDHLRGHKFECNQCNRWFSSKKARRRHFGTATACVKVSAKSARTRCWICDTIFQTKTDFDAHKGIHEAESPPATPISYSSYTAPTVVAPPGPSFDPTKPTRDFCELCWNNFEDIEHHKQSSLNHIHGPKFECDQCKRWFSNKQARKRHFESTPCITSSISGARARCHICDTILPCKLDLKKHQKAHKAEKIAAATSAQASFEKELLARTPSPVWVAPTPTVTPLQNSTSTSTGTFCELCWNSTSDTTLHNTKKSHLQGGIYKCDPCSRWFYSKGARRRHFATTGCVHTPITAFRCQVCGLVLHTGEALRSHKLLHKLQLQVEPSDRIQEIVWCELCWRDFVKIEEHRQGDIHSRGPTFTCTGCKRWFTSKSARSRHFEPTGCLAISIIEFPCHDCELVFATGLDIITHRAVHRESGIEEDIKEGDPEAPEDLDFGADILEESDSVNTVLPTFGEYLEAEEDILEGGEETPSTDFHTMSFCELCWMDAVNAQHHKTEPHTLGPTYTCSECNRWFSSQSGRRRHFGVAGCARTPIGPLRCPVCDMVCGSVKDLKSVKALREHRKTHEPLGSGADLTSGHPVATVRAAMETIPPVDIVPTVDTTSTITFCELCWMDYPNIELHKKSSAHLRGKFIKCPECIGQRWFSSKGAKRRHLAAKSCIKSSTMEFRCCDCNIGFESANTLRKHLQDKKLHPPREVVVLSESDGYCEKCKKVFSSAAGLATHLASVIHNPIMEPMKCLSGEVCKKSFVTPSGMLAHLESGSCRSKLNRDLIDDLVIANDPTNIITDSVVVETRARDRMVLTSSEYSTSIGGSVMFTPSEASITHSSSNPEDWSDIFPTTDGSDGTITPRARRGSGSGSEDSDTDSQSFRFMSSSGTGGHPYLMTPSDSSDSGSGIYLTTPRSGSSGSGVYLTPSESGDSSSGVYLTPSDTNRSGVFTSTDSFASQLQPTMLRCPLCPSTKTKQFRDIDALHTHIRSKVHAAKIYHCPLPIALGTDSAVGKKKKQKSFTTLSGLAQHVEAGACEGGKETFNAAISFVNERLNGLGMEDMKVIGQ